MELMFMGNANTKCLYQLKIYSRGESEIKLKKTGAVAPNNMFCY